MADADSIPVWDKVEYKKSTNLARGLSDSTEEYVIPLTVNDKSLSSLLEIKATPTNITDIDNYTTNDYLHKKVHEPNADVQKMMELLVMFFYMENKAFGNIEFFNIPAKYFPQITTLDAKGNKTIVIKDVLPQQEYMVTICKYVECDVCHQYICTFTGEPILRCDEYSGGFNNGGGGGFNTGPGIDPVATGGGNGGSSVVGGGGDNPPYTGPPLPPCPHTAWYRGESIAAVGNAYECDPIRPIVATDTIKNPCDQADSLTKNVAAIALMNDLKTKAADVTNKKENGYIYKNETDGTFSSTPKEGELGKAGIDFAVGAAIDGFMHNHYTGLLSVFSPDDLWSMSTLFLEGKMIEKRNFSMVLTTANGTNYLLKIADTVKFENFAILFLTGTIKNYEDIFTNWYKINKNNPNDINEKGFLQYIQRTNGGSGLKLFRGNGTFTNWTPIELDNNNIVKESPCE